MNPPDFFADDSPTSGAIPAVTAPRKPYRPPRLALIETGRATQGGNVSGLETPTFALGSITAAS